jgi:hypothetical protein
MRCWNFGSENPSGKRFWGDCGASLDSRTLTPARQPGEPLPGERRHLTVLFCDLVNSTSIATQLDAEEWREVLAGYHRSATDAIECFGGYIAQYLGDGLMAYFGWPEAHENDAERAARAGLAIPNRYRSHEAVEIANKIPKPKDLGDLYLFKGRLHLMQDPRGVRKARQCFNAAIRIACGMGAKSDELSAVIEIARLLKQQNRTQQAYATLAEIYNLFTEGFDTADLKEAKALLEELSC